MENTKAKHIQIAKVLAKMKPSELCQPDIKIWQELAEEFAKEFAGDFLFDRETFYKIAGR